MQQHCSEHFQGDYCRLSPGHNQKKHVGRHHRWENGDKKDNLPPLIRVSSGIKSLRDYVTGHYTRFVDRCRAWNKAHNWVVPDKSTASILTMRSMWPNPAATPDDVEVSPRSGLFRRMMAALKAA